MTNSNLPNSQLSSPPSPSNSNQKLKKILISLIIFALTTISVILAILLYDNSYKKQTAILYDNQNNPQGKITYVSHSGDYFDAIYANLPELESNKYYQAWYVNPKNQHIYIDTLRKISGLSNFNYAASTHYNPSLFLDPPSVTSHELNNYTTIIVTQETIKNDAIPETIILEGSFDKNSL